jgi:formamidopyrimidine-DNA glycosylase
VGLKILSFNCKGKFIWFDLDSKVVFNTLGMTGSWNNVETKHTRIKITTTKNLILCFNDIRNFGTFQIKSKKDLRKKLASIGPDMLFSPPSSQEFINIFRKKDSKNICDVLMNQNVVSGVGNYIKAESLWYSRINPHTLLKNLTDRNLETLRAAIIYVINKSYQEQGATIKSYYTFSGEEGNATKGFVVYGRQTDYNGHIVSKDQTPDKRTTHWVKSRQIIG